MADVFISYSRRDKAFVESLHQALEAQGRSAWVDWKDIPATAEWEQEVYAGIEAADAFIFVISPNSVASTECRKEINCAIENNKRLVPIVCRDVDAESVHPVVAARNWIFCRATDDFESNFKGLIEALDTDLEYVRTHTRLLMRAIEWDKRGRDSSLLMRGNDLREDEGWLAQSAGKEPRSTPLQTAYILASQKARTRFHQLILG